MYYPILRGRQNELLAIRELLFDGKLDNVIPIIEPVKASSTLLSVLKEYQDQEKQLFLVVNPIVGSFEKELGQNAEFQKEFFEITSSNPHFVGTYYIGNNSGSSIMPDIFKKRAYYLKAENREDYEKSCLKREPHYTLISSENQRIRRIAHGEKISLVSAFHPQKRNADYCEHKQDYLTEEPFYYKEEGLVGFSDYSVIGEEYSEGGFLPKVVALHFVHWNEKRNQLLVRHFTSSRRNQSSDIAKKFNEALGSLLLWTEENPELFENTKALSEMRQIYNEERFPGLGVAKRLAIKHHLELVNNLLGRQL